MTNTQLVNFEINLPTGSLDTYIQRIKAIPLLSTEEEHTLAKRFYENNDLEAARTLVISHLRFVISIAKKYTGYGLPLADLVQEGNIGLMKAVKRFNPNMGIRLITFAVHWIKAEIHEFILRNWRIVKVATTKAQRKLFFNLRSLKKRLGWLSQQEAQNVAKKLNVPIKTVIEMDERLNSHDEAFEIIDEDDDNVTVPALYLADSQADPAVIMEQNDKSADLKQKLSLAFEQLDDRSKQILESRWLSDKKVTLQELAVRYQISIERIRQIEKQALEKLKSVATVNY